MAENVGCTVLCPDGDDGITLKKEHTQMLAKFIQQEYNVHL